MSVPHEQHSRVALLKERFAESQQLSVLRSHNNGDYWGPKLSTVSPSVQAPLSKMSFSADAIPLSKSSSANSYQRVDDNARAALEGSLQGVSLSIILIPNIVRLHTSLTTPARAANRVHRPSIALRWSICETRFTKDGSAHSG